MRPINNQALQRPVFFQFKKSQVFGPNQEFMCQPGTNPAKGLVIDIVVADIPPKYGMLLSRSWGTKLQGNLQRDMSYDTIPIFNKTMRLY